MALWLWNLWRLPPCLRVKIQAWQQWLFSTLPPTSANQWSLLSWITTVSHMWHVMSCAFPYALSEAFPDFNPSFLPRGEIKDFFPSSLSSKLEKVLALKNLIHAKNYRGLHRYQWGCPWWLRWKKKKICLQCRRPGFTSWVRKILWRRGWLPTPVFLPGEFHEHSLAGYSPWGCKQSDTTKKLHFHFHS